jgi:hypothetical protein
MTRASLLLLLACGSLAACASSDSRQAADGVAMTTGAVGKAATQPLRDLNLVKDPIPAVLKEAAKDPYRKPERTDCGWLAREVTMLDLALGPDADIPSVQKSLGTQSAEAVANAAGTAVGGVVGDLIPFRTLVRRLTGAEENAQEMRDALKAGDVRRAYLKGLGLERGCAYPAAPAPAPVAQPTAAPAAAPAQTTPAASPAPGT